MRYWIGEHPIKTLLMLGMVVVLYFAWTANTFDNFLWRVHLNHSDCATNGFGATFCGDALTNYQERVSP